MDNYICPICANQIDANSHNTVYCNSCSTRFHKSCLELVDSNKNEKCPVCGKDSIETEPNNKSLLRDLTIVVEHTGKRIPVLEVHQQVTAQELLTALANKLNLPTGIHSKLYRVATEKQILSQQSLQEAGIQDNEVLIADFARIARQTKIKSTENSNITVAGADVKKNDSLSVIFGDTIGKNSLVFPNYSQEFIITTADKLKIFLIEYQEAFKARIDWITPLGMLLAIIPTLVAADFKQFLGIEPSVWNAIFIVGSIVCVIWLLRGIYLSIKFYERSSIEYTIQKIKRSSEKLENQSE